MKTIKLLILVFVLYLTNAYGQNEIDALRYSNTYSSGSARFVGLGGAFGSLGGDFSTLSVNPAGLAVFRGSEFVFSPSIYTAKTSSKHYDRVAEDLKYNFNLGNVGLVSAYKLRGSNDETPGWKFVNFGIGVNRIANFHNRILIEGNNLESSLMTDYLSRANGKMPGDFDPFDVGLAWETFLIDPIDTQGNYISAVPINGGVKQSRSVTATGAINEMVISLAGNYDDKFYIGGSIGVPFVKYSEQSTYREIEINDTVSNFQSFTLNEDITTSGSGVNFKLGMIFRPVDFLRIGAAVHTPTFYTLKDSYSRTMTSYFDNGNTHTASSPNGKFDYELTTPMRIIGSLGFIIGEYGLISADYEFVDYSEARLRSKTYKFFDENDAIQGNYRAQSNIRLGGEVRLNPISVRLGYALYGSPFKSGLNNGERTALSFGIGIREKDYYMDIAYVYTSLSEDFYLYNPALVRVTNNTFITNSIVMTLGFRL